MMQNKFLVGILSGVIVVSAVSIGQITVRDQQTQIDSLLSQITTMQNQLAVNRSQRNIPNSSAACVNLNRNLNLGARGSDVIALQNFLSTQPGWPRGQRSSGRYDATTQQAVQRFQTAQGLISSGTPSTTGFGSVGPSTIARIRSLTCVSSLPPGTGQEISTPTPAPTPGARATSTPSVSINPTINAGGNVRVLAYNNAVTNRNLSTNTQNVLLGAFTIQNGFEGKWVDSNNNNILSASDISITSWGWRLSVVAGPGHANAFSNVIVKDINGAVVGSQATVGTDGILSFNSSPLRGIKPDGATSQGYRYFIYADVGAGAAGSTIKLSANPSTEWRATIDVNGSNMAFVSRAEVNLIDMYIAAPPATGTNGNSAPIPRITMIGIAETNTEARMVGSATDDGLPAGGILSYSWTQLSGPTRSIEGGTARAYFSTPNSRNTSIDFPYDGVGVYIIRLTVSDGELSSYADYRINVTGPAEFD